MFEIYGNKVKINDEDLAKLINEAFSDINKIDEGIDIDYDTRLISYNPNHEENVDTSVENNPTYTVEFDKDVKVWSILKRLTNVDGTDGNPLLYALKHEKGWKISPKSYNKIVYNIYAIIDKFAMIYNSGVTIVIPSSNNLNKWIATVVTSRLKDVKLLENVLVKISTDEIRDIVDDSNSYFYKYYKGNMQQALRLLNSYLSKMDSEKNGYFTRHYVIDSRMRNVLDMTIKLSDTLAGSDAEIINDNDVLLIDDSISRGQTIKEAIKIIKDNFKPKSISVLTLFSKMY